MNRYCHSVPDKADNELDPFEYRLYGHYRRACLEKGSCQESLRQTARVTRMSPSKVLKVRCSLAKKGYITVETLGTESTYVYLIANERHPGEYKIGKSSNPERRLQHIRAGRPDKLSIVAVISTKNASKLEKRLHQQFKGQHILNEWYQLSDKDVAYIQSMAVSHD